MACEPPPHSAKNLGPLPVLSGALREGPFLRIELIEQGFGFFAVGGVEAPIEPVVDFGEHHARIAISSAQLEG
jgi:hypothetical protein